MFACKTVTVCPQGHYFNDYCNWRTIPEFRDFAFNSPAAEIAGRMMGSSYAVFYHEHVLNKEPGGQSQGPCTGFLSWDLKNIK